MSTLLRALHPTIAAYVEATNSQDRAAFLGCFREDALVDDAGRVSRGIEAIRHWSEREIFAAQVQLEVLAVSSPGDETIVTTRVEGNFDRTGLPDPVVIDHCIALTDDRISRLTCRLARATA